MKQFIGLLAGISLVLGLVAAPSCTPPAQPTLTPEKEPASTAPPVQPTTPTSTPTPTLMQWQYYRMIYSIRIGGVHKLWMPVPCEWGDVGMKDVKIVAIFPSTEVDEDKHGNKIAFWQIDDTQAKEYSITFEVSVAPISYVVDPAEVGNYDTSSELYQRYTKSTEWIQSDNPEIAKQAKEIVGNETNPYLQAMLLHKWVAQNIKSGEPVDALTAYQQRSGDCGSHAFLFIAFLRALGVPARTVSGIHNPYGDFLESGTFSARTLYTHVWSEFYLPNYGWVQNDTSSGDLYPFPGINQPRLVLSRGDDIVLGHGYPLRPLAWFHMPHSDFLNERSTSPSQAAGETLTLEVERLP